MYLKHFQLDSSPFTETVKPDEFFPGAGREDICTRLLQDIRKGEKFAFLLGEAGSGKTQLCQLLVGRLGERESVVYVANPMGSFDDLLQLVCGKLGIESDLDRENMVAAFRKELEKRCENGQRVVLIIDDAEQIFLAALERLLRLLCDSGDLGNFTLILAGNPSLSTNLEQLAVYCTGVDLSHGYELPALEKEETDKYLVQRLCRAGLSGQASKELFAGPAVDKIFQVAQGNFQKTNMLAEEALRKAGEEQSYMVLPEHVDGSRCALDSDAGREKKKASGRGWLKGAFVGCICAAGIVIAFLLFRGEEKDKPVSAATPPVIQESPFPQVVSPPQVVEKPDITHPSAARKQQGDERGGHQAALEPGLNKKNKKNKKNDSGAAAHDRVAKTDTAPEKDVTILSANAKRPAEPQSLPHLTSAVTGKKTDVKNHATVRNGRVLFDKRMRAGAAWLSGAYSDKYTIQLIMLTSESARKNMEKLLAQPSYISVLDKLYILRKKTNPSALFLFYGTFPTMEAARQARNVMPFSLRKHHPYALSIADALTKTED